MTRSKFRLAAALVLVALLGGFGLHATQRPALMAGENEPAKPAPKPAEPPADDATFLRRLSLDLRGTLPSYIEMTYFLADKDQGKRRKVAAWMLEPAGGKTISMTEAGLQALGLEVRDAIEAERVHSDRAVLDFLEQRLYPPAKALEKKPEPPKDAPPPAKKAEDLLDQLLKEVGKSPDATNPVDVQRRRELMKHLYDMIAQPPPPPEDVESRKQLQRSIDRAIEFLRMHQAKEEYDAVQSLLGLYNASPNLTQKLTPTDDPKDAKKPADAVQRRADEFRRALRLAERAQDGSTDAEFLRRLMLDLTGTPPTSVEMNYFLADKDPNKRRKVTEWLMKNPEVARKVNYWKRDYASSASNPGGGDRFDKLLNELLAGSRGDEQILEALTLATLARFPTESERQFLGVYLKSNGDRRAAWTNVLHVLTNTQEFRQHAASLQSRAK